MMGLLGSSSSLAITVVLGLILNAAVCYGGTSSNYTRTAFPSYNKNDMPVNSEAFYVPPGINSPQQVCSLITLLLFFLSLSLFSVERIYHLINSFMLSTFKCCI